MSPADGSGSAPEPASQRFSLGDLRPRLLAMAILPMLLATGLLGAYFAHREIEAREEALHEQGRNIARHLAEAVAYDLFTGNVLYLKRLLDYELAAQGAESISVGDSSAKWWLVSGLAVDLTEVAPAGERKEWRRGQRLFFSHPIRLQPNTTDDPYLASNLVKTDAVIGQVVVAVNRRPVEEAKAEILVATFSLVGLLMLVAGLLAWRLSEALSRPLHAAIASVRRIAAGQLETRLPETSSGGMGDLERGVNQMASALEKSTQDLERRVREATSELLAQKQSAEAAAQAKSKFLAAASHDLRQPLHALTLLVAALKEKVRPEDTEVARLAQHIEASAHSMEKLLNALLDLSRLDAGVVVARPECFPVATVFERLERRFGPLADEKGLGLRVRHTDVAVFTDPLLLERILGNLLANAIRYTDRGRVLLGVRLMQREWIRFEVWDTGRGIPEAYQEKIFEEYFQLDNPERDRDKGLGLGLAIVQRSARLLGSPVQVRSWPGRGSCFSLRVARCQFEVRPEEEDAPAVEPGRLNRSLVVFIDDDESILEAMTTLFDQWGIETAAGTDTTQVKQDLLDIGRQPDAILTDYRLRDGRTGVEAIAELRTTFGPHIPAALITGDTASTTIQAIASTGLPVLHKPLKPAKLRAFLSHLLARRTP